MSHYSCCMSYNGPSSPPTPNMFIYQCSNFQFSNLASSKLINCNFAFTSTQNWIKNTLFLLRFFAVLGFASHSHYLTRLQKISSIGKYCENAETWKKWWENPKTCIRLKTYYTLCVFFPNFVFFPFSQHFSAKVTK